MFTRIFFFHNTSQIIFPLNFYIWLFYLNFFIMFFNIPMKNDTKYIFLFHSPREIPSRKSLKFYSHIWQQKKSLKH